MTEKGLKVAQKKKKIANVPSNTMNISMQVERIIPRRTWTERHRDVQLRNHFNFHFAVLLGLKRFY